MTKIISTDNGDYKKAGFMRTAAAITAGGAAMSAVQSGMLLPMNKYLMPRMQKASQSCDNVLLRKGISDAFQKSNLAKAGVEIIDVKDTGTRFPSFKTLMNWIKNPKKCLEDIEALLDISKLPETNKKLHNVLVDDALNSSLPKWAKKLCSKVGVKMEDLKENPNLQLKAGFIRSMFESGKNAGYMADSKKIGINIDKLGASAFHEMGHAINHNYSKFWRGMQKLRLPMSLAAGLFSTTALLKRKKVEGEEPKNIFDKAATFVKNNVGQLVTLSFVPIIAEELAASYRGNKMAEKFLPPQMAKKIKMSNRFGAVSYIGCAIAAGIAAVTGSKMCDIIAKPEEV